MSRRKAPPSSAVRLKLIEVASAIISKDGLHALTTSRLAHEVGLTRYSIHYYFENIEDVVISVIRSDHSVSMELCREELYKGNPVDFVLKRGKMLNSSPVEYVALAFRSEKVREEVGRCYKEFQDLFTDAIRSYMDTREMTSPIKPEVIGLVVLSLAKTLAEGVALGLTDNHSELLNIVDSWTGGATIS